MNPNEPTLESWKEISAYLQRDAKTARKWEKEEGLPVHRHTHNSRASVYAYASEIDAWRAGRKVVPEPEPPRPLWKMPAFALTLALCLVMVGNGIRPQTAIAQQGTQGPAAKQVWGDSGLSGADGAPSADGRHISFTDWATGDLAVRDLIVGATRRLTNTGGWAKSGDWAEASVISPDGQSIVYAWFVTGGSPVSGGFELRVIPTAGGTPRTLHRSEGGSFMYPRGWSPDGKQILVTNRLPDRTTEQIAMLSVTDGSVRVIKSLGRKISKTRLSPDGRFIAYDLASDEQTGASDIFVLATDGSGEAAIVEGPSNDSNPIWSPDGARILFASNRTGLDSLWEAPVRDGRPNGSATMLRADLTGKQPLGISPSGVLYYLTQGAGGMNVYVAEVDSAMQAIQAPRIVTERFMNSNHGPSVSPDGEQLAYYSDRPGQGLVIVVRDLKAGSERDITVPQKLSSNFSRGPMWSGDSRSLVVTSRDPQRQGPTFLRVSVMDGAVETIHLHDRGLQGWALSPDGKSLYKAENLQGPSQLVRVNLETQQETILKPDTWVISVAVSPDSQQVAYLVSGLADGGSRLEVMPATGGAARVVFSDSPWIGGSRYSGLGWTADGQSLLFVKDQASNEPSVLWRVPLSGGLAQSTGISKGDTLKVPQMHPNGRQVFFGAREQAPGELWALENFLPK